MKAGTYLSVEVCRVMIAGLDQHIKDVRVLDLHLCDSLDLFVIMVTGWVQWSQTSNKMSLQTRCHLQELPWQKEKNKLKSFLEVSSRLPPNLII